MNSHMQHPSHSTGTLLFLFLLIIGLNVFHFLPSAVISIFKAVTG